MFQEARRPVRLSEEVTDQIERAILEHRLEVGDRLPSERAMALSFNISKRTLREAMRVVEQKGLVEITPNGSYVKEPSTENLAQGLALLLRRGRVDWRHIIDFRKTLDCNIAGLAAENATRADVAELESLLTEVDDLMVGSRFDWPGFLELDIRIHLKLARMSANPINEWILSTFLQNMTEYFDSYRDKEQGFSRANRQNLKRLVAAIRDKDPQEAAKQALAHLELGSDYVGR